MIVSLPKPKTASAVIHKPQKQLKIKKKEKSKPIRLDSIKKIEPDLIKLNLHQKPIIDECNWEKQVKIWNDLTNMYEVELKRINEIKALQTQKIPKVESTIAKKQSQQDRMRRTGGGFTQINFFPNK